MSRTKTQIVERAAQILGKKRVGQAIQGSVSADLTQSYNEIWTELNRRGIVTWGLSEAVPDEYVNHMAYLVANARTEGVSQERLVRIELKARDAEKKITYLKDGAWENPEEVKDY